MTMDNTDNTDQRQQANEAPEYEAPAIVGREPLEAVATVCDPSGGGKQSDTVPACTGFLTS